MIRIVILVLASILLGFAAGRRFGIGQGLKLGMAYGALDLRRRSLEEGQCPICSLQIQRQDEVGSFANGGYLSVSQKSLDVTPLISRDNTCDGD